MPCGREREPRAGERENSHGDGRQSRRPHDRPIVVRASGAVTVGRAGQRGRGPGAGQPPPRARGQRGRRAGEDGDGGGQRRHGGGHGGSDHQRDGRGSGQGRGDDDRDPGDQRSRGRGEHAEEARPERQDRAGPDNRRCRGSRGRSSISSTPPAKPTEIMGTLRFVRRGAAFVRASAPALVPPAVAARPSGDGVDDGPRMRSSPIRLGRPRTPTRRPTAIESGDHHQRVGGDEHPGSGAERERPRAVRRLPEQLGPGQSVELGDEREIGDQPHARHQRRRPRWRPDRARDERG